MYLTCFCYPALSLTSIFRPKTWNAHIWVKMAIFYHKKGPNYEAPGPCYVHLWLIFQLDFIHKGYLRQNQVKMLVFDPCIHYHPWMCKKVYFWGKKIPFLGGAPGPPLKTVSLSNWKNFNAYMLNHKIVYRFYWYMVKYCAF